MKKYFTYFKVTLGTLVILGLFMILPLIAALLGALAIAWIISAILVVDPDDCDD
jgi:hypothetical protein|tara:strand:+ start:1609 stop:1770 length:162 start_codon:yes stop_codon:yes gene_type:complete